MSKMMESVSPMVRKPATKYQPTQEEIAVRAYEIYLQRGAAPGNEMEDWILAERELTEKNGNGRAKPSAKGKAA